MNNLSDFVRSEAGSYHCQEFYTSGTFDVPADVYFVYITGVAGGGSGGGGDTYDDPGSYHNYGAGGGGSGEHAFRKPVKVVPLESITVTVGAGGVGPYSIHGISGNSGGDTIFGTRFRLLGGRGGLQGKAQAEGSWYFSYGRGGYGGGQNGGHGGWHYYSPSIGYLYVTPSIGFAIDGVVGGSGGGAGGSTVDYVKTGASFVGGHEGGTISSPLVQYGGGGGASFYGNGGDGGESSDGGDADGYGAGGGGGATYSTGTSGGDGGDGFLIVEWFG